MRVLAVATRDLPVKDFDPVGNLETHVAGLTFVALIGLFDPPRPEAAAAIAVCKRAGIQVKMIVILGTDASVDYFMHGRRVGRHLVRPHTQARVHVVEA